MTSELAPLPIGPRGTQLAPARARMHRRDWARLKHYRDLRRTTDDPIEAFTTVALDPGHGIADWAGKASIPRPTAARLWGRFCERVVPSELESSKAAIALDAATYAPAAWGRVKALVNGDFGEAKVRVGSEGEQRVSIDAAAAGVQLAAAKFALQTVGVGVKSEGATNAATFNGPTNVVFSFAAGQKARANGSGS